MGEGKDDWVEEQDIGSRTFRKNSKGDIVEVMSDGTLAKDFDIGGESFSGNADFSDLKYARNALRSPEGAGGDAGKELQSRPVEWRSKFHPVRGDINKPGGGEASVPDSQPEEVNLQDKVRQYLSMDKNPDPRMRGISQIKSIKSVKDLEQDIGRSSHSVNPGNTGMSSGHGLQSATFITSDKSDPLKSAFRKTEKSSYDKAAAGSRDAKRQASRFSQPDKMGDVLNNYMNSAMGVTPQAKGKRKF